MTVVLTALIVAAAFALAAGAEYLYLAWWGYDRCTRCLGRGTEHNSTRPCIVCAGDGRREP